MSNPKPGGGWTIQDARNLYNIHRWGADYYDIDASGNVVAKPLHDSGATVALSDVIAEARRRGLQFPVLIRFQDILHHRVKELNESFQRAIKEFTKAIGVTSKGNDYIYIERAIAKQRTRDFDGAFQVIHSMDGISDEGISGVLRGVNLADWTGESWRIDIAALDGALQLAVLWARRMLGGATLPTTIEEFHQKAELVVAPTIATEGKIFQRAGQI